MKAYAKATIARIKRYTIKLEEQGYNIDKLIKEIQYLEIEILRRDLRKKEHKSEA